jgi:hypothetical protein
VPRVNNYNYDKQIDISIFSQSVRVTPRVLVVWSRARLPVECVTAKAEFCLHPALATSDYLSLNTKVSYRPLRNNFFVLLDRLWNSRDLAWTRSDYADSNTIMLFVLCSLQLHGAADVLTSALMLMSGAEQPRFPSIATLLYRWHLCCISFSFVPGRASERHSELPRGTRTQGTLL